jgi:hypothetical protein
VALEKRSHFVKSQSCYQLVNSMGNSVVLVSTCKWFFEMMLIWKLMWDKIWVHANGHFIIGISNILYSWWVYEV